MTEVPTAHMSEAHYENLFLHQALNAFARRLALISALQFYPSDIVVQLRHLRVLGVDMSSSHKRRSRAGIAFICNVVSRSRIRRSS